MFDPIRPVVRDDRRIDWWYRQNLVLFAHPAEVSRKPGGINGGASLEEQTGFTLPNSQEAVRGVTISSIGSIPEPIQRFR
jgi:hypothetical protein